MDADINGRPGKQGRATGGRGELNLCSSMKLQAKRKSGRGRESGEGRGGSVVGGAVVALMDCKKVFYVMPAPRQEPQPGPARGAGRGGGRRGVQIYIRCI